MARERRTRAWWGETVSRWKTSGLAAAVYAKRHGLSPRTLLWWSSQLGHGTRAKREPASTAMVPLEVKVAQAVSLGGGGAMEIAVGRALLRIEVGTDVAYVSELVRRLGAEPR